jgi:IclR family acetate operon transcriptional repressor
VESAVLSVPDGAFYRCDAAVDGSGLIKYTAIVGTSLPAHGGAAGHAIFAFLPQDEVDGTLGGEHLERFTDTSVVSLSELHRRYEQVRADGYAVSDGEYDPHVAAVAAPVTVNGVVVASMAAIGPRQRVMDALDTIVPLVRAESAALSAALSAGSEPSGVDQERFA